MQNRALLDKGCDTCLWSLIAIINKSNKENHPIHLYYIDFSKVFDSVEHWAITKILNHIGAGYAGEIISQLLTNSYTSLKINNNISNTKIPILRGTKQGDVILPLLFIFFIALLLWKIDNTTKGININNHSLKSAAIMDDIALN